MAAAEEVGAQQSISGQHGASRARVHTPIICRQHRAVRPHKRLWEVVELVNVGARELVEALVIVADDRDAPWDLPRHQDDRAVERLEERVLRRIHVLQRGTHDTGCVLCTRHSSAQQQPATAAGGT